MLFMSTFVSTVVIYVLTDVWKPLDKFYYKFRNILTKKRKNEDSSLLKRSAAQGETYGLSDNKNIICADHPSSWVQFYL